MIAIDTNVLLRYLLHDDAIQAKKADALINGNRLVLISHVVLAETIWTLCGKKYRLKRDAVVSTIHALFQEKNIVFENAETVWRALGDFQTTSTNKTGNVDFPDALILNIGRQVAQQSGVDFEGSYTFDKAAQQLPEAFVP